MLDSLYLLVNYGTTLECLASGVNCQGLKSDMTENSFRRVGVALWGVRLFFFVAGDPQRRERAFYFGDWFLPLGNLGSAEKEPVNLNVQLSC
ncbi:hypothetical protein NDN08_008076 [Rhodosorus marinus]|uniref:Uncharacterized protein n=1 Tax=Rhodosorus marinus TaxID=101924 RepID=A0AAV8V0Z8_9RHOD|nr:hypothetical protein NDN08_008076 [Rhodosorus marinus]